MANSRERSDASRKGALRGVESSVSIVRTVGGGQLMSACYAGFPRCTPMLPAIVPHRNPARVQGFVPVQPRDIPATGDRRSDKRFCTTAIEPLMSIVWTVTDGARCGTMRDRLPSAFIEVLDLLPRPQRAAPPRALAARVAQPHAEETLQCR